MPGLAAEQDASPGSYVTPSVSLGEVYDDNLFSSPSQGESDHILRLTPSLEAGYQSAQWMLHGDCSFDAEHYRSHPELNSSVARRHAAFDLGYQPAPRLQLGMDADYTRTNNPGGLALNTTGLVLGRVAARFITVEPSARYRFDELTTGKASYYYEQDAVLGGLQTDTRMAKLGIDRVLAPRDTLSVDYAASRYRFGGIETTTSQVLTLGWTHELDAGTDFTLGAGPRKTGGQTAAEITASLSHEMEYGAFSGFYTRSQAVVLGESGPVDTRTVGFSLWYAPAPYLEFQAVPSYLRDTRGDGRVDVYRVNLSASYALGRSTYLIGLYQYGLQQGTLDLLSDQQINRATIFVGLVTYFGLPAGVNLGAGRAPIPWGD